MSKIDITFYQIYGLTVFIRNMNLLKTYNLSNPNFGFTKKEFDDFYKNYIEPKLWLTSIDNKSNSLKNYTYSSNKIGNKLGKSFQSPHIIYSGNYSLDYTKIKSKYDELVDSFLSTKTNQIKLSTLYAPMYNGKVGSSTITTYNKFVIFDFITTLTDNKFYYYYYDGDSSIYTTIIPNYTMLYPNRTINSINSMIGKYNDFIKIVEDCYNLVNSSKLFQRDNSPNDYKKPNIYKGNFTGGSFSSNNFINILPAMSEIVNVIKTGGGVNTALSDLVYSPLCIISSSGVKSIFLPSKLVEFSEKHNLSHVIKILNDDSLLVTYKYRETNPKKHEKYRNLNYTLYSKMLMNFDYISFEMYTRNIQRLYSSFDEKELKTFKIFINYFLETFKNK